MNTPGSRLKGPSKIAKPLGGGTGGVVPRSGAGKTASSSVKGVGKSSGVTEIKRRGASASSSPQTPRVQRESSFTRPATPGSQIRPRVPAFSREGSETRLSRTSSQSSLKREGTREELLNNSVKDDSTTEKDFIIGDTVLVGGTKRGVIAYIGETRFAKGEWAGIVLDEPEGKNDGSVGGVRYFQCEALRGVFSKLERLTKVVDARTGDVVSTPNQTTNQTTKTSTSSPQSQPSTPRKEIQQTDTLKIGDRVFISGTKCGTLRYLGPTEFAKGEWAGVELDEAIGKNDGAVAGTRYFQCQANYGLFAPVHRVSKVKGDAPKPPPPQPPANPPQPKAETQPTRNSVLSDTSVSSMSSAYSSASQPFTPVSQQSPDTQEPPPMTMVDTTLPKVPSGLLSPAPSAQLAQIASLQEALESREKEIQNLLVERENERIEVAKIQQQVLKTQEEMMNAQTVSDQKLQESHQKITTMEAKLDTVSKEKDELSAQLEEEKRKVEDLQFTIEEQSIMMGEENKNEPDRSEIESLQNQLNEYKKAEYELTNQLQMIKNEKDSLQNQVNLMSENASDKESQLLKSLEEAQKQITDLEPMVQHASQTEQVLQDRIVQIGKLEKELENQQSQYQELQDELDNCTLELQKNQVAKDELDKLCKELTDSLNAKDEDFNLMHGELEAIKAAAIETQKQLHISEARSENLSTDKNKLETELSLLVKNSGNSSEQMKFLNEQLRQKDKFVDELQTSLAEAQVHIGRITEELSKTQINSQNVQESASLQLRALEERVAELEAEVDYHTKKEEEYKSSIEEFKSGKTSEVTVLKRQLEDRMEELNKLSDVVKKLHKLNDQTASERDTAKAGLENYKKEKDSEIQEMKTKLESVITEKKSAQNAYSKLEQNYQGAEQRNKELTQLCEDYQNSVDTLKKENDQLSIHHKQTLQEKDDTKASCAQLQEQIKLLQSEASDKEDKLIQQLRSQLETVSKAKEESDKKASLMEQEKVKIKSQLQSADSDKQEIWIAKAKLEESLQSTQSQIESLKKELQDSQFRENNAKVAAQAEKSVLQDELKTVQFTVEERETEISQCKEQISQLEQQISKLKIHASTIKSSAPGDVNTQVHELETKLISVANEKENCEQQIQFLNSVIVDLQKKLEQANDKISLLETGGDFLTTTNGDISMEEVTERRYRQRAFCDICDQFDLHDTDDCPTQAGGDIPEGVSHHGERYQDRAYCSICEAFGHSTEDCDEEETF